MSSEKIVLNHTEVAIFLGIGKMTLYRMIEDGRFPVKPIPDTKLYSKEKIVAWVESNE